MIKFIYERPNIHQEHSAVRSVVFEVDEEYTLSQMQEAYDDFLRAIGYNVQTDDVQEPVRQQDAPRAVFSNMAGS